MKSKATLYCLLLLVAFACNTKKQNEITIGIQAFGSIKSEIVDSVAKSITEVYGFKTILLPTQSLPKKAFVNIKSPRYRADSLLRILKFQQPDTIDFTIGLLDKDISTTKKDRWGNVLKPESKYLDWGVFGLGYRPGPSCVVSTFRFNTADKILFYKRLKKISMHEMGHNLGLPHCEFSEKCVMRDAVETIRTIDQVELSLCSKCKRRILYNEAE